MSDFMMQGVSTREEIEELRNRLIAAINRFGLSSPDVLVISQKLDTLHTLTTRKTEELRLDKLFLDW